MLLYEAGQYLLTAKTDDVSGWFFNFAIFMSISYFALPSVNKAIVPIPEPKQD